MENTLYPKCFKYILILAFVSLWATAPAIGKTKTKTKDELSEFEDLDIADTPSKAIEDTTKKEPEIAKLSPHKNSQKPNETQEQYIDRLKAEIRKTPRNIHLLGDLAEELYKKQEYDKVVAVLWKHVERIDRDALLVLVRAHEKRGEHAEMIRSLNVLVGKDENDAEAYYWLGRAYSMARKNKETMESFQRAVELSPKLEAAYEGLIELYTNREPPNLYELRILYQDMVKNIGPRPEYLRKICDINTQDATYEPAYISCQEAIAKDPNTADAYVNLALALEGMRKHDEAMSTIRKAVAQFPQSEFAHYVYGKLLEDQKSFVEAMNSYKKATQSDAKSARSWLGLATSSFEIRKFDISLEAYKKACQLDKKTAVAFRRATTVLRNTKNTQWIGKFEEPSETCTF